MRIEVKTWFCAAGHVRIVVKLFTSHINGNMSETVKYKNASKLIHGRDFGCRVQVCNIVALPRFNI